VRTIIVLLLTVALMYGIVNFRREPSSRFKPGDCVEMRLDEDLIKWGKENPRYHGRVKDVGLHSYLMERGLSDGLAMEWVESRHSLETDFMHRVECQNGKIGKAGLYEQNS